MILGYCETLSKKECKYRPLAEKLLSIILFNGILSVLMFRVSWYCTYRAFIAHSGGFELDKGIVAHGPDIGGSEVLHELSRQISLAASCL